MSLQLIIYVAIVIIEIICSYAGFREGVYVFKPLIMLSLLFWRRDYLKTHPWLWVGMWFGLGGDVFLMFGGANMFMAGLGSFLVMQVFYIVAFQKTLSSAGKQYLKVNWWKLVIPFALYGFIFLMILHAPIAGTPNNQGLWIPVVAYSICLCSMGVAAAFRFKSVSSTSFNWVLAGAVLFILSDSGIALNKFLSPFEASTLFVMSTYAAAQWLIVWGISKK